MFILALMNEGDAAAWKEQLLDEASTTTVANNTDLDLGTFQNFQKSLVKTFLLLFNLNILKKNVFVYR